MISKNKPIVSIVIGIKDLRSDGSSFINCLNSLINQTLNKELYEVIIVNYGGSNKISKLVKILRQKNFRYIYINQRGVFNESRSKNIGIKSARGEYVLCTNADIVFSKECLDEICMQFAQLKKPKMLIKKRLELPENYQINENINRLFNGEAVKDKGINIGSHTALGDFQAAKKTDFTAVKGYDERMVGWGGMDNDLTNRLSEIGVSQKWLPTEVNPIFHQYHDFSARKHIKHNINLILAKSGFRYRPKENEWGIQNKKYKIFISSDFTISKTEKTKIINNLKKMSVSIFFLNEPENIYSKTQFDGVLHIYEKINNLAKVVSQVVSYILNKTDISIVKNQSYFTHYPIIGYNARSYLILSSKLSGKLKPNARFIIDRISNRYYFTYEYIRAEYKNMNAVKYGKFFLKSFAYWHREKKKPVT